MLKLTEIDDELDNLEASDPLLPPDSDATSTLEVVPVHHDVDSQVQRNRDPGNSGIADQLGVAENSSSAMVVAVEESYRVLGGRSSLGVEQSDHSLSGFFLRNKKQVSSNSRYLVR